MQAYISAGSNQGDSRKILHAALQEVRAGAGRITAISPLYRTKPWGSIEQPDFFNLVFALNTKLTALELLTCLQQIEQDFKRVRTVRWGPRTLDLDIISCDDVVSSDPRLTLPHPRAQERAFVLAPLCDIAPDMIFPDSGLTAAAALAALGEAALKEVVKLDAGIND